MVAGVGPVPGPRPGGRGRHGSGDLGGDPARDARAAGFHAALAGGGSAQRPVAGAAGGRAPTGPGGRPRAGAGRRRGALDREHAGAPGAGAAGVRDDAQSGRAVPDHPPAALLRGPPAGGDRPGPGDSGRHRALAAQRRPAAGACAAGRGSRGQPRDLEGHPAAPRSGGSDARPRRRDGSRRLVPCPHSRLAGGWRAGAGPGGRSAARSARERSRGQPAAPRPGTKSGRNERNRPTRATTGTRRPRSSASWCRRCSPAPMPRERRRVRPPPGRG